MQRLTLILLLFVFGCGPKFQKLYTLEYEIRRTSEFPITYSVSYFDQHNKVVSKGPISDGYWRSDKFEEVPAGQYAQIEVKIGEGQGSLEVNILRDGVVHEEGLLVSPEIDLTVSSAL